MDSFKLNKMETKTITIMENVFENNKLIADFMRIPFDGKYYLAVTTHLKLDERNYSRTAQDLKFRTSWDWLMPVISKIYDIAEGEQGREEELIGNITHNLLDVDIDETYKSAVEFIKWYKTN